MIVLKFGGTSVADAERISEAIRITILQPEPRVVVVSAASGVTNLLLDAARLAAQGADEAVRGAVDEIHRRHADILDAIPDPVERQGAREAVAELHALLDANLERAAEAGVVTAALSDAIVSTGEKSLSTMMAATMRASGHKATALFADTVIATDHRHGNARPDRPRTRAAAQARIMPVLQAGETAVVTGFVGFAPDGSTTTLGRGGSDYSATLIGAALDADEVQIWTDVPGVLSADPRKVSSAAVVPHVSFDEAQELAHFGAKVLHPRTIRPAVARNIPVRILSTFQPHHAGTVVTKEAEGDRMKAVTSLRGLILLTLDVPELEDLAPAASTVFRLLHEDHVEIVSVSQASSRRRMTFLVDAVIGGCARLQQHLEQELDHLEAEVTCNENVAVVAAVGEGAANQVSAMSRMLSILHRNNVPVISSSQQTSNVAVLAVIAESAADKAVQALHDAMVRPAKARKTSRRRRRSDLMAEAVRVG
jgi:bifunctional aspartokinase / homoserine dehydrogenase 1